MPDSARSDSIRAAAQADHNWTPVPGFTPETLNVQPELKAATPVAEWAFGDATIQALKGRDTLWIVVRRPGRGGVALRTFPVMGMYTLGEVDRGPSGATWHIDTASGRYVVRFDILGPRLIHLTSRLTPRHDLLVAFWPRDLYVLDNDDCPRGTHGRVEAGQRGLNAGLCYFCLSEPAFGNVLYMQNLTAMNAFFADTGTRPDGIVGGQWPELGYLPPAAPNGFSPPVDPLTAGQEYVISDALIAFGDGDGSGEEVESARAFIDMLADIYPHLTKTEPVIRDWIWRAGKTLHDLKTAPAVHVEAYGRLYFHPYTASEYPDSMVQMSILEGLREYEMAGGFEDPLSAEIIAGMPGFYDEGLKTLRRYLPNVGADKNAWAVDSWYLYHPIMNLGRLAINGEAWARKMFFDSLDFGIRAARHFDYQWPIIYDLRDFSVICQYRGGDDCDTGLGQTDVGGIYAFVMLQAHQLSGDATYLDEAAKALKALEGRRFELAYQTNLTAWGAVACLKLWRVTGDARYRDQSLTFVASFLHNCELWGSQLGWAHGYANFFGVTCLHDGPYMAAYEAFEAFSAFDEYLHIGGEDIPASVRLLLAEYWRYGLDVLWSFYPDGLPPEALATEIRNGYIDRELSFPLEDLYGDGQPAGQVGQEIYGAAAAFIVVSRAYTDIAGAPFKLFAEYPAEITADEDGVHMHLKGPPGGQARLRVILKDTATPPLMEITQGDHVVPVSAVHADCIEYRGDACGTFTVRWQPSPASAT